MSVKYTTVRHTTYMGSNGKVTSKLPDSSFARGGNPANGSTVHYGTGHGSGVTVFRNNGGAGTVIDSRGNISSGRFTWNSHGDSVFVPSK